MFGLALRTVRYRPGSFAASFLATFLGACLVMTFASLLDTAAQPGVDDASRRTLLLMTTVVGGWGFALVATAVVSTLTLLVRQRDTEIAVLKSVGATPAQIQRMVVGEAAVVALVAAAAAVPVALLGSDLLVDLLHDTHQVAPGVLHAFGTIALTMGVGITVAAAMTGAALSTRDLSRIGARDAAVAAATGTGNPRTRTSSRARLAAGWTLLGAGTACGVLAATALRDYDPVMGIAGMASILWALGFALLSPALVRLTITALSGLLTRSAGVSGYLTVHNITQRTRQTAAALIPIILFTGIGTATLYMQRVDDAAVAASGVQSDILRNIQTLNLVVVGMITVFTAIMLVNTLTAATTYRRGEFGQHRLAGATPPQVFGMVAAESAVIATTGILFGSVASIAAVVPYSIAKTGSMLPDTTIALYLGIVATAAVLTLASSLGAARHALRTPAVEAAAAT